MNVKVRNADQLKLMRVSGNISAHALKKAIDTVKAGVNLLDIEKAAEDEIIRLGGKPSFKTVPGYFWATCLTINEEVVHGIPREYILKEGDLLSIDLGAVYKGWHTDCAWSVLVSGKQSKFLKTGEEALWSAVKQAKSGNRIGDISSQIQSTIEGAGYSVVRSLVGHGVGKELHEEPEVPGIGKRGYGFQIKSGMTLAIEAIYTEGGAEVVTADDGWTVVSKDGSLGGLFEMSVIVGEEKCEVLTDWRSL